jgi:hypothetical protein
VTFWLAGPRPPSVIMTLTCTDTFFLSFAE